MEIPTKCPSCESTLVRVKDQLFCRNPNCYEKRIKQLQTFAKVMQIKGLGEKTIEKLNLSSIEDIYTISQSAAKAAIGEKLAEKLMKEIDKSKTTDLSKFLAACSIPLIGTTAAKKLAEVATNPLDITTDICKKAGLGPKASENLMNWLENSYNPDLPISFIKTEMQESEYNVCISGRIPGYTKAKLKEFLAEFNVSTTDNVNKTTTHVIAETQTSTKCDKARSLNIPILTLDEFKEIIK